MKKKNIYSFELQAPTWWLHGELEVLSSNYEQRKVYVHVTAHIYRYKRNLLGTRRRYQCSAIISSWDHDLLWISEKENNVMENFFHLLCENKIEIHQDSVEMMLAPTLEEVRHHFCGVEAPEYEIF